MLYKLLLLFLPFYSKISHVLLVNMSLLIEWSVLLGKVALLVGEPRIVIKLRHRRQVSARLARIDLHACCINIRSIPRQHRWGSTRPDWATNIHTLELLDKRLFWHATVAHVRTSTHLCHDLWALCQAFRHVYLITDMLHATYSIEYVILRVNTTSHITLLGSYALRISIGQLLSNSRPTWTSNDSHSRLWYGVEVITDWFITRCADLCRSKVTHIYTISPTTFIILAGIVSLLVYKLLLLLHDDTFALDIHSRLNCHRLIILIVVGRFASINWHFVAHWVHLSRVRHNLLNISVIRAVFACHLLEAHPA